MNTSIRRLLTSITREIGGFFVCIKFFQEILRFTDIFALQTLFPSFWNMLMRGELMRPAVELSFLDEDSQRDVADEIGINDATPSHD